MLEDLNLLEKPLIEKINRFNVLNCELPEHFTSSVKCIFKDTIEYGRYCSCITSSSGLRIFISNNWFYIAAILAPLYKPLFEYKSLIDEIVPADILKNKNEDIIIQNINNSKFSNEEKELLIKFATDYNWWNGGNGKSGKSLDRGDWHNSAILALAKVVNVSQSYICVLWEFLGQKPDYVKLLDDKINFYIENGDPLKVKETRNTNAGTLLPLQQIFYGAPGTGKSHKVNEVTETLPKSDVFRTTFHSDSDYSTFVGCYKPKMVKAPIRDGSGHEITTACEDEKKRIAYEYEPQAFLKAYVRAYETNEPVFLVIEEINRGNCAQIFGDMFQLLDRNENGESDYAIKPETAIQEFLNEKLKDCDIADETVKSGEEMRLPGNLHIWATMNTSDQSLFPIDSAFKRRWDWKYMPINTRKESWSIKVNGAEYSWSDFLEKINAEIDVVTHSEDKKLGFYFCKAENGVISAEKFVSKVLFYIYNDVFKDYGFEKDIFNDTDGKLSFGKFYQENGDIQEDKVAMFLKNLGVGELTSISEKPVDVKVENAENN